MSAPALFFGGNKRREEFQDNASNTALLFGGNKRREKFQDNASNITHFNRTRFDNDGIVRARVRFVYEDGTAVAWLDDLYSLGYDFKGEGSATGRWEFYSGTVYRPEDAGTGLLGSKAQDKHRQIAGVKIKRVGDTFEVYFYGVRSNLPGAGEPKQFLIYLKVPVPKKSPARYNSETWEIVCPEGIEHDYAGGVNFHLMFEGMINVLLPKLLNVLMYEENLKAQSAEDIKTRHVWAAKPKTIKDMSDQEIEAFKTAQLLEIYNVEAARQERDPNPNRAISRKDEISLLMKKIRLAHVYAVRKNLTPPPGYDKINLKEYRREKERLENE